MPTLKISPAPLDIQLYKGATLDVSGPLNYLKEDGCLGNLVDLTGCTAKMQIRASIGSPLLDELTTENDRIILGGQAGTIRIIIPDDVCAAYAWTDAIYSLVLIDAAGATIPVMAGKISITPGPTV